MADAAEKDALLTDWERRKLAIVHDIALALSDGEWDALRWHFAEVWDDAYDCCASDGTPQLHNGNPYRDDEADAVFPPAESVPDMLARVAAEEEAHADDSDRPHYRNRVLPPGSSERGEDRA